MTSVYDRCYSWITFAYNKLWLHKIYLNYFVSVLGELPYITMCDNHLQNEVNLSYCIPFRSPPIFHIAVIPTITTAITTTTTAITITTIGYFIIRFVLNELYVMQCSQLSAKPDLLADAYPDPLCHLKPDLLFPVKNSLSITVSSCSLHPAKPVTPIPAKSNPPLRAHSLQGKIQMSLPAHSESRFSTSSKAWSTDTSLLSVKPSPLLPAEAVLPLPVKPDSLLPACFQYSQIVREVWVSM